MRHVIRRNLTPAAVAFALVAAMHGQTAARPTFEAVSVKPAAGCGNESNGGGMPTPGRLHLSCVPVRRLVQIAYGMFADGATQSPVRIEALGGPSWADSEPYDINAKAEGSVTIGQMYGPMLQVVLEERFKLKVHREFSEQPVYTLTVGKNGSKLKSTQEGSCALFDASHMPPPPAPGQPEPKYCGRGSIKGRGGLTILDSYGATMTYFASSMLANANAVDRPVIDKTGLDGRYDIHLEYAASGSPQTAGSAFSDPAGASIFTAIQEQLGLKLTAEKGAVPVLVIDHLEKPTEN